MSDQKILNVFIIDDNEVTRAVLRMVIQGDTYNVVGEAANGKTGLERLLKLRPDIICLDIVLPDIDGLDMLQEIKQHLPQAIVLMVTASNDATTVKTAISRGANGFIIKPFNAGTVLNTIQKSILKLK